METIANNLLSPIVLAFVLGVIAALIKSDLEFPEPMYAALSIYLLLAIGLKGGIALSETQLDTVIRPAAATIGLGILTPIVAYVVLRLLGRIDSTNAAAIAAHYGSVSFVTFVAAQTFAENAGYATEGYLPALVALLEVPAIVVAMLIGHMKANKSTGSWQIALREVLSGRSVVLLAGGLVIGWLAGAERSAPVVPFFVTGFQGALTLFLLEMGLVAARRLRDLGRVGPFLVLFAIGIPLLFGCLGAYIGHLTGMSVGGSAVFAAIVASSSYIAAPAAVRISLPSANPTFYLTSSLGVTFPFNLVVGIPLYLYIAKTIGGGS